MHLAFVKSDQPTAVRRVSCLLSFTKLGYFSIEDYGYFLRLSASTLSL
jgi:hypothetical protein